MKSLFFRKRKKQSKNQTCLGDRLQKLEPTNRIKLKSETKITSVGKFPKQVVSSNQAEESSGFYLPGLHCQPGAVPHQLQWLSSCSSLPFRAERDAKPGSFQTHCGYEHPRQAQFRDGHGQYWEFDLGNHVAQVRFQLRVHQKQLGRWSRRLLGGPPLPPLHKKHHRDTIMSKWT